MIVKAVAPNRVLDFGGWTDTWFAEQGCVLNFAIDLYAKVVIVPRDKPGVSIVALDYGEVLEINDPSQILYDGKHDLLKAALNVTGVDHVDISVYSDVPPGCGTGSSAAVSVALIGALAVIADLSLTPHEVASLAHKLETEELGIQSGVQDQISAAAGGIGYHIIDPYPRVSTSPIRLPDPIRCELENRLVVAYTGQSHLSGDVHKKVIADYGAGVERATAAIETLRNTPVWAKSALMRGDFVQLAEIMNINTAAQKDLHPDITTHSIEVLEYVARRAGAIGFKINGAGGGGSVTLLSGADNSRAVESAVKDAGFQVLRCRLDDAGLRTWTTHHDSRRPAPLHTAREPDQQLAAG